MKRGMSKLLSVLLIATLVFTSASVAFAGTEKEKAAGDTAAAVKDAAVAVAQQQAKAQSKAAMTKGMDDKKFKLVTLKNKEDLDRRIPLIEQSIGTIAYTTADVVSGKGYGYALPVTVPDKGVIEINVAVDPDSRANVTFGLYKDVAMQNRVDSTGSASYADSEDSYKAIQVPGKGTYYLGVYSSSCPIGVVGVALAASYINGGDRTLNSGKEVMIGQQEAQTNYFKFKAKSTGSLKIALSAEALNYEVTLCDGKKQTISTVLTTRCITPRGTAFIDPTFGVKEEKTYYIKVKARYNSSRAYGITATNKQIKEKSGTKKAKAVTLKKNKKVKGTLTAGSKQTDWYKFVLKKDSKIKRLTLTGETNDILKAKICNSKGKAVTEKTASIEHNGKSYYLTNGKLKKGTYYIKVYNPNKKSSGYYTLSWK